MLYNVRSTKYQVWGCGSSMILLVHFETNRTLEGTLYLVLGTLYKLPGTKKGLLLRTALFLRMWIRLVQELIES